MGSTVVVHYCVNVFESSWACFFGRLRPWELLSGTRLPLELDHSLKVRELLIRLGKTDNLSLFHELKLTIKETEIDSKHEVSNYAHQTLYAVRLG